MPAALEGLLNWAVKHGRSISVTSAIVGADVFDGERLLTDHVLVLADGLVKTLVPGSEWDESVPTVDCSDQLIVPGFIDLQLNGGGGVLFNDQPTVAGIAAIAKAHRQFGTTGFLATFITDEPKKMHAATAAVKGALSNQVPGLLGIHLEGPFLNRDRKGVHDGSMIREMSDDDLTWLSHLGLDRVLVTLAPEQVSDEVLSGLSAAGVIVWAGHSEASYEQTIDALESGISGFTHLFNAMSPLATRAPGMVGAALEHQASWVGVIADGHHVHPANLRLALRLKPAGKILLVTDAMPSVGSSATSFSLNGEQIQTRDGCNYTEDGVLAGSDLDMCSAVNNIVSFTGVDYLEALRMASLYPAQALGLDSQLGRIAPEYRGNLVALDANRRVTATWIDGVIERHDPFL
jgi:N-acetylglucosamine-6-phosphate deacetylase